MNPQVILLGAPGSGKGTQAERMIKDLGYNHVSTGDLLRNEMVQKTDLGIRINEIMNSGQLVDDDTVLALLKKNCDISNSSYIFDGYPRNIEQTKSLDKEILGTSNHIAIYFEVDLDKIVERIVNRRSCAECKKIYNLVFSPPKSDDICDNCNGELIQRKDDNEDVVRNRIEVYSNTINPVLAYYESKGNVRKVDASKAPETLFLEVKNIIQNAG